MTESYAVSFRHATNRNTKAYIIDVGPHRFYISYSTVIGYDGPNGCGRRDNNWGPTTGRHFREMGIANRPILSGEEFARIARVTWEVESEE